MTTNLISATASDFANILAKAATFNSQNCDHPPAAEVVNALLQAEKTTKQQRLAFPQESLLGCWRLHFVVTTKKVRQRSGITLGKGWYLPKFIKAQISFNIPETETPENPQKLQITNQLQVGLISFKFTGPARYLGKKNILAFNFTQIQIGLLGRTIYSGSFRKNRYQNTDFFQQSVSQLPFFAFFYVSDKFIAARGRGGGLAIWIKED